MDNMGFKTEVNFIKTEPIDAIQDDTSKENSIDYDALGLQYLSSKLENHDLVIYVVCYQLR
jgi:hypothetical protein